MTTLTSTCGVRGRAGTRYVIVDRLHKLAALWRSRRDLAGLTPEQRADVGIPLQAAQNEAARPLWDVPAHWMK